MGTGHKETRSLWQIIHSIIMSFKSIIDLMRTKIDYQKAKIMGDYDKEIKGLSEAIDLIGYEIEQKKLLIEKLQLDLIRLKSLRKKYGD